MRHNLLTCDSARQAIFIHSGVSQTVIDSFSSPGLSPQGIITYNFKDVINLDGGGRVYHLSGVSNTVKNSFSTPGVNAIGLTFDGLDLISLDAGTEMIYKYSGVSATVKDSFPTPKSNPRGLAFDGQNLWHTNSGGIIYQFSGFSSAELTSFTSPATFPEGIIFDGINMLHTGTDKVYKFSGVSSTVTTSFPTPATNATGIGFDSSISSSDSIQLNNADLLVVYNKGQGGSSYAAMARRFDISKNSWGSEVTVDSGNTGYTHPAIVQLPSNASTPNRILCAFRDKAAGAINVFKSDDNGASFTSLTTITADLDENNKISMGRSGNTIIIVYTRGVSCFSVKSTDNGGTWGSENTINTSAINCDLAVLDTGSFVAAYEHYSPTDNQHGLIYMSSSVNGAVWNVTSSIVMVSSSERYTTPTTSIDDAGAIYVIAHETTTKDLRIVKSDDKTGTAWGSVQSVSPLENQGNRITATTNLGLFKPTAIDHSSRLFTVFEAWDGINGHLSALKSHNWRTVTETTGYRSCYYPIYGFPEIVTSFVLTNSGGSSTISNSGVLTLTTTSSTDTRLYKRNINNVRTTSGVKVRFKVEIESGSTLDTEASSLNVTISDGASAISSTLRFSPNGFYTLDANSVDNWSSVQWQSRQWDEFSDTILDTTTVGMTDNKEFLLAMKNNDFSIWYRDSSTQDGRWISSVENAQVSVLSGDSSFIQFGTIAHSAVMKVHSVEFAETDDNLANGFTNPDDLAERVTATGSKKQYLKDGIEVTWGGSEGVVTDFWLLQSAYTFPKEDMLSDSPSDFVRTENDGSKHVYVFDAGVNKKFIVDQFNFINANIRTGSFQMNDSDTWTSPSVDEAFTVRTETSGTITATTENTITDSSLSLRINQLARPNRPMYIRMTSGIASGNTYAIESNTSTTIKTTSAILTNDGVIATDNFVVFGDRISYQITEASYRFVRLVIDAQDTAEEYYRIGKFLFGTKIQLSHNFISGYTVSITPNIATNTTSRSGQVFSTKAGESKQSFSMKFKHKTSSFTGEIEQFFESIDWGNTPFVFIQDGDSLQDFILGRMISSYLKEHLTVDIFNMPTVTIEEEV